MGRSEWTLKEDCAMKGKLVTSLAVAAAVVGLAGSASAQAAKRPAVAVMDFDFGTVHEHWWGNYDIGKGMADQVVDALVNDGSFRVIERKKLDTVLAEQDFARSDRADPSAAKLAKVGKVLGVKYIIAGSITKFGGEEKSYGGGGLVKGKLGGLGLKKAKTEVSLTARMIDATTGEILMSAKGEGVSKKGGGLTVGGGGFGGGAGFSMGSSDYKASAIGEAQEAATVALVTAIIAKKDRLE
jgi:curli biogenesis system outer membrane secretion channel CsgG